MLALTVFGGHVYYAQLSAPQHAAATHRPLGQRRAGRDLLARWPCARLVAAAVCGCCCPLASGAIVGQRIGAGEVREWINRVIIPLDHEVQVRTGGPAG